jgi:acetyltransferase
MLEPTRAPETTKRGAVPSPSTVWDTDLTTRTGYQFHVRSAVPSDETALADFFTKVEKDDLRFRFLSPIRKVGHNQLAALVTVDHMRTENFLAIETHTGIVIATAMIAADAAMINAEVAIAIRADCKQRGISWTLLDHVTRFAMSKGIKTLESIESRENYQAIEMERERGWMTSPADGDPSALMLRKTLDYAAV